MSSRRCLTCVCPDVSGQVVAPAEAPHADPALEGPLSWELPGSDWHEADGHGDLLVDLQQDLVTFAG